MEEDHITIRVHIDRSKVGDPGAEAVLLERIIKSHTFVTSVVKLKNDGFAHLLPDETTRRNKA